MLKVKSNSIFRKFMKEFNYKRYKKSTYKDYLLLNEIVPMFNMDIEKVGDCFFFKSLNFSIKRIQKLSEYDKSEFEKDFNEIYLRYYLKGISEIKEPL